MNEQSSGISFRRSLCMVLILVLGAGTLWHATIVQATGESLPERLSDREFWQLTEQISESDAYFRSDNLLSNETSMQDVIPELIRKTLSRGAYLGVGPEQNFTYIAALKPRIAFIIDIRRGNLHTQLMYKALFELATDRVDFIARLFARKRPEGLEAKSAVQEVFRRMEETDAGNEGAFSEHLKAVRDLLVEKHKLPLSAEDLAGIEYVYHNFYTFGPDINYSSSGRSFGGQGFGRRGGNFVTYADLMTLTDENGVNRSFLANEDNFKTVKALQEKNLIIPVVGDFSGPKALRAIGKYLKGHNVTVTAFYLSNVEMYLGGVWHRFCANVASLPLDEKSTFIRTSRNGANGYGGPWGGLATSLGDMQAETSGCAGTP